MKREELLHQLDMSYDEQVASLLDKYGHAKYDYFCTKSCKSKNQKVSRTGEGLFCHHIREDVADLLSSTHFAVKYPFEYQKAENLVYCNILEHLMLHVKISVIRSKETKILMPGVFFISNQLNDMFKKNGGAMHWQKNCFSVVKENYQEYLMLLSIALHHVDKEELPRILMELCRSEEDGRVYNDIAMDVAAFYKREYRR